MPFKEKEKYNAYMREYHKKQTVYKQKQMARLGFLEWEVERLRRALDVALSKRCSG